MEKLRKIFIGIICMGILLGIVYSENIKKVEISAYPENKELNKVITVDDEPGDADYTSIQEAINDANEYDIIEVYGGEYSGVYLVKDHLTIIGKLDKKDNQPIPIISSRVSYQKWRVIIEANNTIFRNFLIKDNNSGCGVLIKGKNNLVRNCTIKNLECGILIEGDENMIYESEIKENNIGIDIGFSLERTERNYIMNNRIYRNRIGVLIRSCMNTVRGNKIEKNEIGIKLRENITRRGIHLARWNIIEDNRFISNIIQATFSYNGFLTKNFWDRNFWNDWPFRVPRPIFGSVYKWQIDREHFWINFDFHPKIT